MTTPVRQSLGLLEAKDALIPAIIAKSQEEITNSLRTIAGLSTRVHLDVLDGKFAPNTSINFPFSLPAGFNYSAHLMIERPIIWMHEYGKKVSLCFAHVEAVSDLIQHISTVRSSGLSVGLALLPETSVDILLPYAHELDALLLLTVTPGFYGSPYQAAPLRKIAVIKAMNPRLKVYVDGSMNPATIVEALRAGADFFISGSYVMKAADPAVALATLADALMQK